MKSLDRPMAEPLAVSFKYFSWVFSYWLIATG